MPPVRLLFSVERPIRFGPLFQVSGSGSIPLLPEVFLDMSLVQVQDGGRSVRIFELMQTLVDKTIQGPRE